MKLLDSFGIVVLFFLSIVACIAGIGGGVYNVKNKTSKF